MKLKKKTVFADQHPTFDDVKRWYNEHLHPDVIDLNDEHVYKHVYHEARWCGIFQATQKGAQKFFERAKPNNITDIAALTSIYRPGPLAAKVDDIYVEAKADPSSVKYEHPLVKQCLEATYGCIIFQESLMKLGEVVGGLSLEECDKLRKVITKRSVSGASKAKEDALKLEKKFIEGAVRQGVEEKVAVELFEKMAYFSGYGFNASFVSSEAITRYNYDGSQHDIIPISNFKPGDFVKSRDEATGHDVFVEVVALHDHNIIEIFEFEFDDGRKVKCSMDHKFRVKDGRMLSMRDIIEQDLEVVADTVTRQPQVVK